MTGSKADGTAKPSVGSKIISELEEADADTKETNMLMLGNVLATTYGGKYKLS